MQTHLQEYDNGAMDGMEGVGAAGMGGSNNGSAASLMPGFQYQQPLNTAFPTSLQAQQQQQQFSPTGAQVQQHPQLLRKASASSISSASTISRPSSSAAAPTASHQEQLAILHEKVAASTQASLDGQQQQRLQQQHPSYTSSGISLSHRNASGLVTSANRHSASPSASSSSSSSNTSSAAVTKAVSSIPSPVDAHSHMQDHQSQAYSLHNLPTQIQPAYHHLASPSIMVDRKQGADVAAKACEKLAGIYNAIADILVRGVDLDNDSRMAMRQEFVLAASELDRTVFLSPAGPAFIAPMQELHHPRKRAYTLDFNFNNAAGDPNKHRRTASEAVHHPELFNAVSPHSSGSSRSSNHAASMAAPSSVGALSRPALHAHTHSSPLLPVESHYRPNSAGVSDPLPPPKASDLAASGAHTIGRLNGMSSLSTSTLPPSDTDGMTMDHNDYQGDDVEIAPSVTPLAVEEGQQSSMFDNTPMQNTAGMEDGQAGSRDYPDLRQLQQQQLSPQEYAQQALASMTYAPSVAAPQLVAPPPSQAPTPVPYQDAQSTPYTTPPMGSLSQFHSQSLPMQIPQGQMSDADMQTSQDNTPHSSELPMHISNGHAAYQQQSQLNKMMTTPGHSSSLSGSSTSSRLGPGNLDFTTLRNFNDEDLGLTSPYASSQVSSMSSFPFTASGASGTSGSRSRATSISRTTSASRSRAPSINSSSNPNWEPHELENILGSLTTLPSPINEDDDDPFESSELSRTHSDPNMLALGGKKDVIPPEILHAYTDIFSVWLPALCTDQEATDRKGEKVHQPLMAKKMARLDEEHSWRPFKFRIQPFTNAFQDACRDAGLTESDVTPKLIKHFLWNQPLISRFNDEGKKTKSKGNHVWSIEARSLGPGRYEFRPPPAKIVPVPTPASTGQNYSWQPKVLDSTCQGPPMDAEFSSPHLPSWLEWRNNTLQGMPTEDAKSIAIEVVAEYDGHRLVQSFTIAVMGDDGVRMMAPSLIPASEASAKAEPASPIFVNHQTPASMKQQIHSHLATSTSAPNLSAHPTSAAFTSMMHPVGSHPSVQQQYASHPAPQGGHPGHHLLPSAMPPQDLSISIPASLPAHLPPTLAKISTSHSMTHVPAVKTSPISPHRSSFANALSQSMPASRFPPQPLPTDATTLASASHIKAKLVEQTTAHHDNLSCLNPGLLPADPHSVSAAVDAAISQQIAATAAHPTMPSATEVFNATLEISARSQQIQHEQLSRAVAAVAQMQQLQPVPPPPNPTPVSGVPASQLPPSAQVTSQLEDFTFTTPSSTPGVRSPETVFTHQMADMQHQ